MKKIIFAALLCASLFGFDGTDFNGNKIHIEGDVNSAFGASPPITAMLYMLAPDKMVGKNYDFLDVEKRFMLQKMIDLPVLGGFFGSGGAGVNTEKLILARPQIVFLWDAMRKMSVKFESDLVRFGITAVYLRQSNIEEMIQSIKLMGEILGAKERAEKLVTVGLENIAQVSKIAAVQPTSPKIYYAQGIDGLNTQCAGKEVFELAAILRAKNVHKCDRTTSRPRITLEQLYAYDPDAIFVREVSFFEELKKPNSPWKNLKAYKNRNIFLEPSTPYSFLNRPPTPMRFLGVVWMCKMLYKDACDINLNKKTKEFYKEFLHKELKDEDLQILYKTF